MIELLTDPATWIGLATLIVLEIVLGIDNLVFIAVLAEKLPPRQRERARIVGLSLALVMRLVLLAAMSWLITLTQPLFGLGRWAFSGRDLILLAGGLFLLFKATTEIHERLEGVSPAGGARVHAGFALVVTQIVILDAVFSLDAVITAVGMVNDLPVMMAAVVISMGVMLLASGPLTRFVNAHPTVVMLCLSFLLMIGLSLVADGLGFHLPKGYLYAAIGFSILIEFLNQWAHRNVIRQQERIPLRDRTAEAVWRLLGGRERVQPGAEEEGLAPEDPARAVFVEQERNMVSGVLTLAERNVSSIMTPRAQVTWVDLDADPEGIRRLVLGSPHSAFPVCRGSLDAVVGIARAKDLLGDLLEHGRIDEAATLREPLYVPETSGVITLIESLRVGGGLLALVADEHGVLQGVVTPVDVLEAIAGEFPDEDEQPEIVPVGPGHWRAAGATDLHRLEQVLDVRGLVSDEQRYISLAGFLLAHFEHLPHEGERVVYADHEFRVAAMIGHRIDRVDIRRLSGPPPAV